MDAAPRRREQWTMMYLLAPIIAADERLSRTFTRRRSVASAGDELGLHPGANPPYVVGVTRHAESGGRPRPDGAVGRPVVQSVDREA